jgi:D-alanyl-D-alanine carboxypeptidase
MRRRTFLKILALGMAGAGISPAVLARSVPTGNSPGENNIDDHIKDYLHKMKNFNDPHKDDSQIDEAEYKIFESVTLRLMRLEKIAGHGNFQILGFEEGLSIAANYSSVGKFSEVELKFMEPIETLLTV